MLGVDAFATEFARGCAADPDELVQLVVPPSVSPARVSAGRLPAGRTAERAEYARYEAGPPAHPAET